MVRVRRLDKQVRLRNVVVARDDALDVLDADPARLARADQVAQRDLGRSDGDRLAGELPLGDQAVERAFEVAAVGGDRLGDVFEDRLGDIEARVLRLRGGVARLPGFRGGAAMSGAPISKATPPLRRERTRSSSISSSAGGRSAATTTCRAPSISALSMWQNSCWIDLALQELHVVDQQAGRCRAALSLNGIADWLLQRRDEAEHEVLGGEVEHLPARLRQPRGARRRLQEVGLAAPDAGMDVERVELRRLARRGLGDRRARPRKRRGWPRPRRTCRRCSAARPASRPSMLVGALLRVAARRCAGIAGCSDRRRRRQPARGISTFGWTFGRAGAAHENLDARHARALRLPQRQQPLFVVRGDPRLQESRRQRQIDGARVGLLEGRAREPAVEDVLAQFGPQALLDARPLIGSSATSAVMRPSSPLAPVTLGSAVIVDRRGRAAAKRRSVSSHAAWLSLMIAPTAGSAPSSFPVWRGGDQGRGGPRSPV